MIPRYEMKLRVLVGGLIIAALAATLGDAIPTLTGQPHIILIVADDMGWNDVGFHGSSQIPTPNIDAMCYNGVILNNYYTQPICTPSRAALMTGKYPIKTGMQGFPLSNNEARSLPLSEKILPEYMRELGYSTHAVGKWHLGMARTSQTPTLRGFDSHYGYRGGFHGYYDYVLQQEMGDEFLFGFDLYRNLTPSWEDVGTYATDLYTREAVNVINNHDSKSPLFLYLAHLAPHTGNEGRRLEAPIETVNKMGHIVDINRRTYAAMVSKLDDSVGEVIRTLKENSMLDSSVIVFVSDNGAPSVGLYKNWGSNWPLRGVKETVWEGGIRAPACIYSQSLRDTPRVSDELMHITDWLPTFVSAAGGYPSSLPYNNDGLDQWLSIVESRRSPRVDILHNIDEVRRVAAYRRGNWKLVLGQYKQGVYDSYYGEEGVRNTRFTPYDIHGVLDSEASRALESITRVSTLNEINLLRERATVNCPFWSNSSTCIPKAGRACLFDITKDPCEHRDLSSIYPHIVRQLKQTLVYYKSFLSPQPPIIHDPRADPARFNFTYTPWLDGCVVDCEL